MKTQEEIVRETANFYNLNNRSVGVDGGCLYSNPDGKKCAVGRCLKEASLETLKKFEGHPVSRFRGNGGTPSLEELLKEEFRGHDIKFWRDLQHLHDFIDFWTQDGISDYGKKYVLSFFGVKL